MTSPLAKLRDRSPLISCAAIVLVIVVALLVSTQVQIRPLQPISLKPGHPEPATVWWVGITGSAPSKIMGDYSTSGSVILLNTIYQNSSASVEYTLPFASAPSLQGLQINYTVYLLVAPLFANNSTPLAVTFDGHAFEYVLTNTTSVDWYPAPVYAPNPRDYVSIPTNVSGFPGNGYLPFSYLSSTSNLTQTVTISVPKYGQIYVAQVVVVAFPASSLTSPSTERSVALLVLPLLLLGAGVILWLFWRLQVHRHLTEVLAALVLQLAIAPFFLHTDLNDLWQFPTLLFNHNALNAGSWVFGPGWLAMVDAPFALPYLFGAQPNSATAAILLKLPAILFGLLTYLVLVRILEPRFGSDAARWYALWSWLFNPIVIFFDSVHGLDESAVAFFLLLFVWQFGKGLEMKSAVAAVFGALTLPPAYLASVGSFLVRESNRLRKALILILPGVALIAGIFTAFYLSGYPVTFSNLSAYLSYTPSGGLSLGFAPESQMSLAYILSARLGIDLAPYLGLAFLVAIVLGLRVSGVSLPFQSAAIVTFGSILAFYLTFPTVYVQHVIWVVPIFALLIFSQTENRRRALSVVLGLSLLGLAIDYGGFWWSAQDPYLAIPFWTVMLLPLSLSALGRSFEKAERWLPLAGPVLGISAGIYVLLNGVGLLTGSSIGTTGLFAIVLIAIFTARLVAERVFQRARNSALLAIVALGVAIAALRYLPTSAPELTQVLYCLVVGAAAWESLALLKHWIRSEPLDLGKGYTAIGSVGAE